MKRRSEVFECVTINSRASREGRTSPGLFVPPARQTPTRQLSHLLNNDAGGGVFHFTYTLRRKSQLRALLTSLPFRWNSWGRTGSHLRVFLVFSGKHSSHLSSYYFLFSQGYVHTLVQLNLKGIPRCCLFYTWSMFTSYKWVWGHTDWQMAHLRSSALYGPTYRILISLRRSHNMTSRMENN